MIKVLVVVDIIMAAAFAWAFRSLPEQIPFFYSKPWGESQIADKWYIFLLPLLMHVIFFINDASRKKFFSDDVTIQRLMKYVNLFFIIAFTCVYLKILYLVS